MTKIRLCWLALCLLGCVAGALGCGPDAQTLVVVAVHSDLEAERELERVTLETFAIGADEAADLTTRHVVASQPGKDEVRLPFRLRISKGSKNEMVVRVTGYGRINGQGAERKLVEHKAKVSFREGKSTLLKVFLGRSCVDQFCDAEESCYAHRAEAATLNQCVGVQWFHDLPEVVPGRELDPPELEAIEASPDASAMHAGGDGGTETSPERDASAVDGGETEDASEDASEDAGERSGADAGSPTQCQAGYAPVGDACLPALSDLTVSWGQLSPAFSAGEDEYELDIGAFPKTIEITARAPDGHLLKLNGAPLASGRAVARNLDLGANLFSIEVEADGMSRRYQLTVKRRELSETYIKASNTGEGDSFGGALALSRDGNRLAVGAGGEASCKRAVPSDNACNVAGAAYVFTREPGQWIQDAYLKALSPGPASVFGSALDLSDDGNTLVVGASTAGGFEVRGEVTSFSQANGAWLAGTPVHGSPNDLLGGAISLSGSADLVAVNKGQTILTLLPDGSTWGAPLEGVHAPVSMSGDGMFLAARSASGSASFVRVFKRGADGWTLFAERRGVTEGGFGSSVALSVDGAVLAVGVPGDQTVRIYSGRDFSSSDELRATLPDASLAFGTAIALSDDGKVLVVGAPPKSPQTNGGRVHVFTALGGAWSEQLVIDAPDLAADDGFGQGVAISGDGHTIAAGLVREASCSKGINGNPADNGCFAAGAVYVYQ